MSYRVEQRRGIPASSSAIWQVLSDFERWNEWNPLYPEISGQLRIGGALKLTETFAGRPRVEIAATVIDWVPNSQILWSLQQTGGLIKRVRYIEIESYNDEDTACILANGELYDGWLGPNFAKRERRRLRAGFEAFNNAVAERVAKLMAGQIKP